MNEPTTDQMNEAVALFMGGIYCQHPDQIFFNDRHMGYKLSIGWWNVNNLKYHSSWDWVHPVWEKFRDLTPFKKSHQRWNHERHKDIISLALSHGTIEMVHESLYKGIKWFNKVNNQSK